MSSSSGGSRDSAKPNASRASSLDVRVPCSRVSGFPNQSGDLCIADLIFIFSFY